MSTDFVVEVKAEVINSDSVIIKRSSIVTPAFVSFFNNESEFVFTNKKSIQKEFWKRFEEKHMILSQDMGMTQMMAF